MTHLPDNIAYLASAYTRQSNLDRAFKTAAIAASRLSIAGIPCFSPIVHGHVLVRAQGLDHTNPAVFAALNKKMLEVCSTLIVLNMDGWRNSEGIKEEIEYFEKMHKPIYDCDPDTLVMKRRADFLGGFFTDNDRMGSLQSLAGDRKPSLAAKDSGFGSPAVSNNKHQRDLSQT